MPNRLYQIWRRGSIFDSLSVIVFHALARFWLSTHKKPNAMKHTREHRKYIKPELDILRTVVERGFAVTSSSTEDVGESDFGADSSQFWQ